ncbi:MAG: YhcH/YjgK/YiaL family protein [Chitinophagaceae bacterium]
MITTTLQHLHRYKQLSANIAKAIDYILATDFASMAPGNYEVDGDDVFAIVNELTTKPDAECIPESHRKYIDIQLVVQGSERFGYTALLQQTPHTPFKPDNDIAFYAPENIQHVILNAGQCVFFFPEDIHQPELFVDAPAAVKKVIMKIKA